MLLGSLRRPVTPLRWWLRLGLVAAVLLSWVPPTSAQAPVGRNVYSPLSARMPTGMVARWSAQAGRSGSPRMIYFQPIEVRLVNTGPGGGGRVTWYSALQANGNRVAPQGIVTAAAPHSAGLLVGGTYRVGISDMPDFPGVSIYPTIEVLDRLHPPSNRQYEFPVPVELTGEDIRLALQGHLVTRVVYLEEPRLSAGNEQTRPMMVRDLDPRRNVLAEADRAGRPMVILRLGSRRPPTQNAPAAFFGTGLPIEFPKVPAVSRRRSVGGRLVSGSGDGRIHIKSAGRATVHVAGDTR